MHNCRTLTSKDIDERIKQMQLMATQLEFAHKDMVKRKKPDAAKYGESVRELQKKIQEMIQERKKPKTPISSLTEKENKPHVVRQREKEFQEQAIPPNPIVLISSKEHIITIIVQIPLPNIGIPPLLILQKREELPPPLIVDNPSTEENPTLTKSIHEVDNDEVVKDNDKVTGEDTSINSSKFIHETNNDNERDDKFVEDNNEATKATGYDDNEVAGENDKATKDNDEAIGDGDEATSISSSGNECESLMNSQPMMNKVKEWKEEVQALEILFPKAEESNTEEQLQDISAILLGNNCLENPLEYWDKNMPVAEMTFAVINPKPLLILELCPELPLPIQDPFLKWYNDRLQQWQNTRVIYKHVDDLILDCYDSSGILFSSKSLMDLYRHDSHMKSLVQNHAENLKCIWKHSVPLLRCLSNSFASQYETLLEELDNDDDMDDTVSQCFEENLLLPNPTLL
eukprot:Gb_15536 [translate_table: standard]